MILLNYAAGCDFFTYLWGSYSILFFSSLQVAAGEEEDPPWRRVEELHPHRPHWEEFPVSQETDFLLYIRSTICFYLLMNNAKHLKLAHNSQTHQLTFCRLQILYQVELRHDLGNNSWPTIPINEVSAVKAFRCRHICIPLLHLTLFATIVYFSGEMHFDLWMSCSSASDVFLRLSSGALHQWHCVSFLVFIGVSFVFLFSLYT